MTLNHRKLLKFVQVLATAKNNVLLFFNVKSIQINVLKVLTQAYHSKVSIVIYLKKIMNIPILV